VLEHDARATDYHAQVRAEGRVERPLLTSGDDLVLIDGFLRGRTWYTAAEVLDYLLDGEPQQAGATAGAGSGTTNERA